MTAYYNENDPKAAAWLREIIKQGHIAYGDVDERSIEDVTPTELTGYTQCHFFAGIGVWSHALRQAGWPDDRPVWTGSCPCQPFSAAGKGKGFTDERHLWPAWFHLIQQCQPPVVFGEQVASKDGLGWIDLVQSDLEGSGYATGAFDLCAAGVGAPHIRQRIYFVGDAKRPRLERHVVDGDDRRKPGREPAQPDGPVATASGADWLADASILRRNGRGSSEESSQSRSVERLDGFCDASRLADADRSGAECGTGDVAETCGISEAQRQSEHDADVSERGGPDNSGRSTLCSDGISDNAAWPSPTNGHWGDADWLYCTDGKWRPVEPGTFPLAHGSPARVGRLRGYGNAIVAPVAQAFVESYMETDNG